jgi:hypothetical protein
MSALFSPFVPPEAPISREKRLIFDGTPRLTPSLREAVSQSQDSAPI